jgi:hypothetical protein
LPAGLDDEIRFTMPLLLSTCAINSFISSDPFRRESEIRIDSIAPAAAAAFVFEIP